MNHGYHQGLATGGLRQRDHADYRMQRNAQYGYIITTQFSGPIDAPESMPAGSMTDTTCRNWRGRPILAQTEAFR
jgi:hypothetical protein